MRKKQGKYFEKVGRQMLTALICPVPITGRPVLKSGLSCNKAQSIRMPKSTMQMLKNK